MTPEQAALTAGATFVRLGIAEREIALLSPLAARALLGEMVTLAPDLASRLAALRG